MGTAIRSIEHREKQLTERDDLIRNMHAVLKTMHEQVPDKEEHTWAMECFDRTIYRLLGN